MHSLTDSHIRRLAERQGFRLTKHQGHYYLTDPNTNTVVAGSPIGWTIEEVAEHLTC
ncbi:hypothetical protein [Nocardia aurea]|uniref:hypothetical protein n=1 Tax=Nocardia aurea TaxID=2144174 RepID=UPI0033BE088C